MHKSCYSFKDLFVFSVILFDLVFLTTLIPHTSVFFSLFVCLCPVLVSACLLNSLSEKIVLVPCFFSCDYLDR